MTIKKFREGGGILCLRKVLAQGGSLMVTIPIEFVRRHGIKPGDLLPVVGGQTLTILPPQGRLDDKPEPETSF